MARYVATVTTPMPPGDAFTYMADVRHFADWDPGVEHAVQVSGHGPGQGAEYDLTVTAGSKTVMRYVAREYGAPRRILLVARTPFLTSVDEIRVEPAGDGSVVTYDAALTLNGPLRLLDPLLGIAFRRVGDRAAAGLRRALGATGRTS